MFDFFSKKVFGDSVVEIASKINSETQRKIVFADTDDLILKAAALVKKKKIATPIIIGDSVKVAASCKRLGLSILSDENILDHVSEKNKGNFIGLVKDYLELRKQDGKILSEKDGSDNLSKPHYYGAMLVKKGIAHGMISGLNSSTKPYYPVFEIIKLAPGVSRTSGLFVMEDRNSGKVYLFADCVMNMVPTAEQLAEIAILSAKTCKGFGMEPRVAMLSFSTRDSAKHESVDRVKQATALVKKSMPDLIVDGEIQLDAAVNADVMSKKCADSPLKGDANVFIFPDLNSANIGYKLVERFAGYEAIGPFLQGVSLPVNDLSRGSSAEEVMHVAAVTVIQSKLAEEHKDQPLVNSKDSRRKPIMSSSGKSNYDPLDRLPSNVRKIIDDSRKRTKKESNDSD